MGILEIERQDAVMVIRMNRPERMNALGLELRTLLAEAWCEFRDSSSLEVAIFTGTGRAFCAGEDMKESVERGQAGSSSALVKKENPYDLGTLEKPVIVAVNGFAMGGGFMLVERADLRVAARGAVFESSEAKRWLLGGHDHGVKGRLPHAVATEMAFAFRFTAERLYDVGFINRLVEPEQLMPTAHEMAQHLLTLPPAAPVCIDASTTSPRACARASCLSRPSSLSCPAGASVVRGRVGFVTLAANCRSGDTLSMIQNDRPIVDTTRSP